MSKREMNLKNVTLDILNEILNINEESGKDINAIFLKVEESLTIVNTYTYDEKLKINFTFASENEIRFVIYKNNKKISTIQILSIQKIELFMGDIWIHFNNGSLKIEYRK